MTGDPVDGPGSTGGTRPGPLRGRAGAVIGGLALVLGLVTGAIALYDRFFTGGTTAFSGDVSTSAVASRFTAFAHDHDGATVQLDLSCVDDGASSACVLEQGRQGEAFLFAFGGERCFSKSADDTISRCRGGSVFVIGPTAGTGATIQNGPTGAGSMVLKGRFRVREAGDGGIFPPNIRRFELNPIKD